MVEPPVVVEMLDAGAPWLVEWCDSKPASEAQTKLESSILPNLAGSKDYQKMMRKKNKTVRTMFVAEEWRDESGRPLLIFVEGPPAPRAHNWFY